MFYPLPFWTPFSCSNYLTFPLKGWEAQFFGNRGTEVSLATSCWIGMAKGIGPLPPASLKPQSPYSSVHLRWVIFSMVSCSFIYPCWTGTACYSLLTWAETKWVRQLIIHAAIISSINMVITGISRGISQLQIPPRQEKDPLKRDCSYPKDSPGCWDPIGSECLSWGLWDFL